VGALVAGAVAFVMRPKPAGAPPPSSSIARIDEPPASVAPPVVAPPPREDLVDVEVRVSPPNASITIDGSSVSGNPFRGRYARGAAMHRIRATAPGFYAKSEDLAFNANATLDLSLERVPVVVHAPAPPPPPPPPPPHVPRVAASARSDPQTPQSSTDVNPAGGSKPRRPIESSNPYGGNE
jgi:hypothetical protein